MSMMYTQVIFCLTLALLISGAHLATVSVKNNCPRTIWPATLVGDGTQLSINGFELAPSATKLVTVPSPSPRVRFWARTRCSSSSGRFTCATGDCGSGQVACNGLAGAPPASLIELTIGPNNGQDFFDLSLVDGFNLPVSVAPQGGSGAKCIRASCTANITGACPAQLQVKASDGSVIGCKSACAALNQPQYCCTGPYCCTTGASCCSSKTCPPTDYSRFFKNLCPQAYSYAKDDETSTFSCPTGTNYAITFCP